MQHQRLGSIQIKQRPLTIPYYGESILDALFIREEPFIGLKCMAGRICTKDVPIRRFHIKAFR